MIDEFDLAAEGVLFPWLDDGSMEDPTTNEGPAEPGYFVDTEDDGSFAVYFDDGAMVADEPVEVFATPEPAHALADQLNAALKAA